MACMCFEDSNNKIISVREKKRIRMFTKIGFTILNFGYRTLLNVMLLMRVP